MPVAIKTKANSVSLTNFVRCDRNIAITTKNKQPTKTAIQQILKKHKLIKVSSLRIISYRDKETKQYERDQKILDVQYTIIFQ